MSVLLSNFEYFVEKKFDLLTRVWVSIFSVPKLLSRVQTLSAKSDKSQKVLPCSHFGGLISLDFGH